MAEAYSEGLWQRLITKAYSKNSVMSEMIGGKVSVFSRTMECSFRRGCVWAGNKIGNRPR